MTEESSVGSIEEVRAKALTELEAADSLESLEEWRVTFLGRRGQLTQILRGLGSLSPEDRREAGASANQLKNLLEKCTRGSKLQPSFADCARQNEYVTPMDTCQPQATLPISWTYIGCFNVQEYRWVRAP